MDEWQRDFLTESHVGKPRPCADFDAAALLGLLEVAPEVATDILKGPPPDQVDAQLVYQAVGTIMTEALRRQTTHVFERGIVSLGAIWELGDATAMVANVTPGFEASIWENLAVELFALGGLAVHFGHFDMARLIARRESPSSREGWLRQGQVASSRRGAPDDSFTRLAVDRLSRLAGDIIGGGATYNFAKFDLYSALVITELDVKYGFYPNAAVYEAELVEPFVLDELRPSTSLARGQVFVGDEEGLRQALEEYEVKARVAAAYGRWGKQDWQWQSWADARTWAFIREGNILEEWG